MSCPYLNYKKEFQPFHLTDLRIADLATAPRINTNQFAANPRAIDGEDAIDFCNRWAGVLAKAYQGSLYLPRDLPMSWD